MKQTDSAIEHVRNYGCYLTCLCHMAGARDIAIVDRVFVVAMSLGYILDNDIPIGHDGWYQCYILDAHKVFGLAASLTKNPVSAKELSRVSFKNFNPSVIKEGTELIAEYKKAVGSHFLRGTIIGGKYVDVFNPEPGVKISGIRTIRIWGVS